MPAANEEEWYWNDDEPEFAATPLEWTRIQTVLFANAGIDIAAYSNEQLGMGLNHLIGSDAGSIPHMANDPSVPLADAMRMMQAFPNLWRDCIGPRLQDVSNPIGACTAGRLGYVCYMWFDVWPTFRTARHIPDWCDALWNVFSEMLDVPCREVQVAALHGIGHEVHALQREDIVERRIARFIEAARDDTELVAYARAAASGMVQ
ncbi:MAG: hypothetical protein Q8M93_11735 [Polaromonas sp.]|uniref:hypothetical protein n=1 Tax=Polaromonas sp. TaxID=1869339 RepID=UPI00272F65C9|nr:hypothetical protein [Polaromonas sp.]MDP2448001.1 hypothetical protein [Polaromonas sp.]MDP3247626.1 hypothetical protein [Polaromonas sp.]MDP3757854.1 hypothetical protein [Polaromonas sp.]